MLKRLTWIILGCVALIFTPLSCKTNVTGPTVTDADVDVFNGYVHATDGGSFEWGGTVLNRSKFLVTSAVKLELINPDNVTFFTTVEHLVQVSPLTIGSLVVTESGVQVPLPVFSSIKEWRMKVRVVAWK